MKKHNTSSVSYVIVTRIRKMIIIYIVLYFKKYKINYKLYSSLKKCKELLLERLNKRLKINAK